MNLILKLRLVVVVTIITWNTSFAIQPSDPIELIEHKLLNATYFRHYLNRIGIDSSDLIFNGQFQSLDSLTINSNGAEVAFVINKETLVNEGRLYYLNIIPNGRSFELSILFKGEVRKFKFKTFSLPEPILTFSIFSQDSISIGSTRNLHLVKYADRNTLWLKSFSSIEVSIAKEQAKYLQNYNVYFMPSWRLQYLQSTNFVSVNYLVREILVSYQINGKSFSEKLSSQLGFTHLEKFSFPNDFEWFELKIKDVVINNTASKVRKRRVIIKLR
jgi:hypothetical protein